MTGTKRAWDAYDVYLFDVDGTLLHCRDAVHYFAFCETLHMLSGRALNLDGVVAHGNTDIGILRDALHLAGVPEAVWRPRLPEARFRLCEHVQRQKSELRVEVLPYVLETLKYLHHKGALLGVATGNLQKIGQAKLSACDLLRYFDFGAYSDEFEFRKDVFAAALRHAHSLAGGQATVCVVGDTPLDVQAAHANGLPVIAVATGVFSKEQLLAESPDICIASFAELLPEALGSRKDPLLPQDLAK